MHEAAVLEYYITGETSWTTTTPRIPYCTRTSMTGPKPEAFQMSSGMGMGEGRIQKPYSTMTPKKGVGGRQEAKGKGMGVAITKRVVNHSKGRDNHNR